MGEPRPFGAPSPGIRLVYISTYHEQVQFRQGFRTDRGTRRQVGCRFLEIQASLGRGRLGLEARMAFFCGPKNPISSQNSQRRRAPCTKAVRRGPRFRNVPLREPEVARRKAGSDRQNGFIRRVGPLRVCPFFPLCRGECPSCSVCELRFDCRREFPLRDSRTSSARCARNGEDRNVRTAFAGVGFRPGVRCMSLFHAWRLLAKSSNGVAGSHSRRSRQKLGPGRQKKGGPDVRRTAAR